MSGPRVKVFEKSEQLVKSEQPDQRDGEEEEKPPWSRAHEETCYHPSVPQRQEHPMESRSEDISQTLARKE